MVATCGEYSLHGDMQAQDKSVKIYVLNSSTRTWDS